MRRLGPILGVVALAVGGPVCAQPPQPPPPRQVIAQSGIPAPPAALLSGTTPIPKQAVAEAGERVHPITLATALKLAGARPLDVQIADQQVAIAARQYDRAKLLWLPNIVTGIDYFRHEGGQQNFAGDIVRSSRGSFAVGVGPNAVVSLTDAVYGPLAARQDLLARHAVRQATENDVTLAVAEAYFLVQQARAELAGAELAAAKADEVSAKAERLADGLAPPLEASRAKVELARRQQAVATARERWRTASAELVRWLRLEPGTLVEPLEPPLLPVAVIDPAGTLDALIPVALTNRPELAGQQAVVQATLARLKQEKVRPLVPSLALRSTATNPSGSLGWGGFGGGPNDRTQAFGSRFDLDFQVLWEFQSLGFANKARVGERRAEHMAATLDLFRTQDRIAAEVSTAFAQAKAAGERMAKAEPALKEAVELVDKSLLGMGQTRRVGDTNVLVVRPQEVVAAVQALGLANADLAVAVGEYNRAQFRLYRALGHPAEALSGAVEVKPTAAPVPAAAPAQLPTVTQTGHVSRQPPLPSPKPLVQDEPRRLPRGVIAAAEPAQVRTTLRDLAIARGMLTRPVVTAARPGPPAELPPSAARPIAEAIPTQPAQQTEVVWTAAASPVAELPRQSVDAPLPDIPPLPPRAAPPAVGWGKAK